MVNLPKTLNVMYSKRCNLECAHCAVEASPREMQKLDLDGLKNFMRGFHAIGCHSFHILGGEPFLFFEDLCELVETISELGATSAVTTNGYWGKKATEAFRKIEMLKNRELERLTLSHDKFHDIPISWIERIVDGCLACGVGVTIKACVAKSEDNNKLLMELTRLKELGAEIVFEGVLMLGRARNIDPCLIYFRDIADLNGPCKLMFHFTLMPDGDLWTCCNSSLPRSNPLFVGNILTDSDIWERIAAKENDRLVKYLAVEGPLSLLGIYQNMKEIDISGRFSSKCDICSQVLDDDSLWKADGCMFNHLKAELTNFSKLRIIKQYMG